jgi:hypothetical protein
VPSLNSVHLKQKGGRKEEKERCTYYFCHRRVQEDKKKCRVRCQGTWPTGEGKFSGHSKGAGWGGITVVRAGSVEKFQDETGL